MVTVSEVLRIYDGCRLDDEFEKKVGIVKFDFHLKIVI